MSTQEKFVKIDNDFVKKGLTLEEAYILGRIKAFSDEYLIYRETNGEIAKAMGRSVKTVKNWINRLVEKGYLRKVQHGSCRVLYSTDKKELAENIEKHRKEVHEEIMNGDYKQKEQKKSVFDGMTLDEKVAYLETMIDQRKFNGERDRDFL